MERKERLSYLMLFCSLVVAAKRKGETGPASQRLPLCGGARRLSEMLARNGDGEFHLQDSSMPGPDAPMPIVTLK